MSVYTQKYTLQQRFYIEDILEFLGLAEIDLKGSFDEIEISFV